MSEQRNTTNTSEHLANERTFLAWIRTSVGIIAFGVALMKFSLFVNQLAIVVENEHKTAHSGMSGHIGIALIAAGAVITVLAFIHYKRAEKEINLGEYRHSSLLVTILAGFVFVLSICLLLYLLRT